MGDDEEYKVQQVKLLDAIKRKEEKLGSDYLADTSISGYEKAEVKRTLLYDRNTKILDSILENDFRSQKWIEKDSKDRKTRKNINENYKLITGQGSLGSKELKERKEAFAKKRMLSSKASEQVADMLSTDMDIKESQEELKEEINTLDVKELSFENDEDLVTKFAHAMPKLLRADHLLRMIDAGDDGDVAKDEELYRKLLWLRDVKNAYEERMIIISSPYYVSVKDEDYTEETLEHMKNSWKNGGNIRPEFADAVLSWNRRLKDEHAFRTGVKEMNSARVDALAEEHREAVNMLSAQDGAYLFIEKYDERVKTEAKESGFKHDVSVFSLSEILDHMKDDVKDKSVSYIKMERALMDVFRMKNGVSEFGTVRAVNRVEDYRDIIRHAELMAFEYASSHAKWFHFTSSGDERYKMSVRLAELLRNLRKEMNTVIEKEAVEPEIGQRKEKEADIKTIIETGAFTSEEAGKEIKDWLLDNPQYKEVLSRIVKGKEELQGDKELLLKFLEDKNRLLVANNMTLSMISDEHPELTMRLPKLKRLLKEHMDKKLAETPKTQEKIYSEVKEFRKFINGCITDFEDENKELLDTARKRKDYFISSLNADATDASLWERPEMEELLLSEMDDEMFKARIDELVLQKSGNEQIVERVTRERGWSELSRKSLEVKLKERLGSVLIFGGELEVSDQTSRLLRASDYFVPEEAEAERRLSSAMFIHQVPSEMRDSLADMLASGEGAGAINKIEFELVLERTGRFMDRLRYCQNLFNKGGLNNKKLTASQWQQLEELKKNVAFFHETKISRIFGEIVDRDEPGVKMTRDSYKNGKAAKKVKSIGFTQGILGDRFLGNDEVKQILTEEEIAYLNENLIQQFSTDDETFILLEKGTGTDIEKIAEIMRKNLRTNADKIRELRDKKDIDETVRRKVLLRVVCASEDADDKTFERILSGESKEFEKKSAVKNAIKEVSEIVEGGVPKDPHIRLKAASYKKRLNFIKTFDRGKYALIAPFLMQNPEFYERVMNLTRKEFVKTMKTELKERFGVLADCLHGASIGDAVKTMYLEERFNDIYTGKLSGRAMFFKADIDAFEKKVFKDEGSDGRSLQDNFDDAVNDVIKGLKGTTAEIRQKSAVVLGISGIVMKGFLKDKKSFEALKSKEKLQSEIEKAVRFYGENSAYVEEQFILRLNDPSGPFFEGNDKEKNILVKQFGQFVRERLIEKSPAEFKKLYPKYVSEFEKTQSLTRTQAKELKLPADYEKIRKEIGERKDSKKALEAKRNYLGYDDRIRKLLSEVYTKKAVVNTGTGHEIELSHRSWQVTRDHLNERLGYLGEDLTPFIIDCLVEKNVTKWYDEAIDRIPGVHWIVRKFVSNGFEELDENAKWLVDARIILKEAEKGEDPVEEDELNLMLVNIYRNEKKFLKKTGGHDSSREAIKGKWYKDFRKNYRELKALEAMEIRDPVLRQEQLGLSRDLRALLSTGLGISDQDSKGASDFRSIAEKGRKYLGRIQELCDLTLERLNAKDEYASLDEEKKSAHVEALREYFNTELINELSNGKKEDSFDKKVWQARIDAVLEDTVRMRSMVYHQNSLSSDSLQKENRNYTSVVGRDAVDNIIEKYGWSGQRKKYGQLSEEGKEFFALALMLMDKSAIGLQGGTARVLGCKELEDRQTGLKLLEVKKYLEGNKYDLKVDYGIACDKLINYGYDSDGQKEVKLSATAYDKALEFAEGIVNRRYSLDEKDIEKAGDPASVIIEAGLLGKEQSAEMSKLSDEKWTIGRFRAKLSEYAQKDTQKVNEKIDSGDRGTIIASQAQKELERIEKVSKKLAKLGRLDFLRLVGVLQNRTAIDASAKDKKKVINEDKREELKLRLSDENTAASLADFASPGACMRAILSCISFKVKDDRKIGGEMYSKGDFDNVSFDREGMVDWQLLERALDLLDEVKKDNIARYAVRHASDYIEHSGNEKAIDEYRKFKGQKDMDEASITEFLKQQAEKDADSGENAEARIAFGGFKKLTPGQKKLFFRVLGQRDLLDISKRNLYRNIFRNDAERNYANEVGRFRLIDEYIEKSRGGNEGISLSERAHYDAFRSLLSTQVDDTADFKSITDVKDALAGEKLYIFKRNTAVDWKLFTRALQFVNRASYELEISEGNAELYRSAGDLSKHGHMSMDYSILRRNIHNTGNQIMRFGVQRGIQYAGPNLLRNLKLNIFGVDVPVGSIACTVTDMAVLILPERCTGALKEIKGTLLDGKTGLKGRQTDTWEFKPKHENEALDSYSKKRIELAETETDEMRARIESVFINARVMERNAKDIGSFINHLIPGPQYMEKPSDAPKIEEKEDLLEEQIKDHKKDKRYGDIRDSLSVIRKKYRKAQMAVDIAEQVPMVGKYVNRAIKFAEFKVIECFADFASGKESLSWVRNALDKSLEHLKEEKLEKLKKLKLSELIKKGKLPKDYEFTEDDIKSHRYWTAEEEELDSSEKYRAAENAAKDYMFGIVEGIVGEKNAESVYNTIVDAKKFSDALREKMVIAGAVVNTAKVYLSSFVDISDRAKNLGLINDAEERAEQKDVKKSDSKKLSAAADFQTPEQRRLTEKTAEHHLDLGKMADDVAKTIQGVEISRDVANVVIQTGSVAANLAGADPLTTRLVVEGIKAGVDFALYCIRVVKDQNALADYFRNTKQGKAEVKGILDGAESAFGKEKIGKTASVKDDKVLDIICAGKGYEKKEELVADTGLKMAASIAYSASNYNPVFSNKIRAVTCMAVLGLRDKVGKTDSDTIASIYDAMKAA